MNHYGIPGTEKPENEQCDFCFEDSRCDPVAYNNEWCTLAHLEKVIRG